MISCTHFAEFARFLQRNHAGCSFADRPFEQASFSFGFQYSTKLNGGRLLLDGNLHFVIDHESFKDCFASTDTSPAAKITFTPATERFYPMQPIWVNSQLDKAFLGWNRFFGVATCTNFFHQALRNFHFEAIGHHERLSSEKEETVWHFTHRI